jgi:hypothetical protein
MIIAAHTSATIGHMGSSALPPSRRQAEPGRLHTWAFAEVRASGLLPFGLLLRLPIPARPARGSA